VKDYRKTKEQLIKELIELRRRVAELQALDPKLKIGNETLSVSLEICRLLFESSPDIIFVVDRKTNVITGINDAMCDLLGYTKDEIIGSLAGSRVAASQKDAFRQELSKHRKMGKFSGEFMLERKDGTAFPVSVRGSAVADYLFAYVRDITESKRIENALKDSEERYRSLVESTEDSIYLVDRYYKYLYMNRKHISRMGLSKERQYLGKAYGEFHSPEETKWFNKRIDEIMKTGKSIREEHKSSNDGSYFLLTMSPVAGVSDETVAVTVISKDITDLKNMEEKLRSLSLSDELTGLYNRRGFVTLAQHQLKMANRLKRGMFMLYADLNNLKGVNDTFGHQEGDRTLIETANFLKKNYRKSDIIARIGGDEFVVIPVGFSGDTIEMITNRFQKSLNLHNKRRKRKYKFSISIGIAHYDPESPCSIDDLLLQADKMMYKQKRLIRKS
jgi:diguanylate cyclase (GGDEF)-like protein/PAS domain S-box-containing protein